VADNIRGSCCHPEGTSTGWRNEMTGTSGRSTKRSAKSRTWGGTTPGWGPLIWKAAWQKRAWGSWWTPC